MYKPSVPTSPGLAVSTGGGADHYWLSTNWTSPEPLGLLSGGVGPTLRPGSSLGTFAARAASTEWRIILPLGFPQGNYMMWCSWVGATVTPSGAGVISFLRAADDTTSTEVVGLNNVVNGGGDNIYSPAVATTFIFMERSFRVVPNNLTEEVSVKVSSSGLPNAPRVTGEVFIYRLPNLLLT